MAAPSTPSTNTTSPITLGILEAAGVAFGGATAGALVTGDPIITGIEVGLVAFFAALGYGGYQAYNQS